MGHNNVHFWHIMLLHFKKGNNANSKKDFCHIWRGYRKWTNVLKVVC